MDDRGYRVQRAERVRDAARSLSQGGQQHRLGRRHHGQEGQRNHQGRAIDVYTKNGLQLKRSLFDDETAKKRPLDVQSVTLERSHARD